MKLLLSILALLILATCPSVASAHEGDPNFRSEITSIRPAELAEGLSIEVVNFDDHVRLENNSGKDVVILGYEGEPYARILADGTVEVNLNSPSHYQNEDRLAQVEVPERADAEAEPEWEQVGENGIFEWHDHRSHYMSESRPPQVEDESTEVKIFDYVIPIEVDGRPAKVSGTLRWVGSDSNVPVIPFVILGLAVIAAGGFWIRQRRRKAGPDEPGSPGGSVEDEETKEAW